jgi:nitroreductase
LFFASSSTWAGICQALNQLATVRRVDLESAIRARRTHKQYGSDPVPEPVVRELVELARWAPNHKLTNPWRFRLLGAETRARIDELVPEQEVLKLRRAPTLLLVTAMPSEDPLLAVEDVQATAAAVQTLLLAATARGLASYWRTPGCFREQAVRDAAGLADGEVVVALVHLGPPASDPPPKERAPVTEVFQSLP